MPAIDHATSEWLFFILQLKKAGKSVNGSCRSDVVGDPAVPAPSCLKSQVTAAFRMSVLSAHDTKLAKTRKNPKYTHAKCTKHSKKQQVLLY